MARHLPTFLLVIIALIAVNVQVAFAADIEPRLLGLICPAGSAGSILVCSPCAPGYYSPGGLLPACYQCATGYTSKAGASSCYAAGPTPSGSLAKRRNVEAPPGTCGEGLTACPVFGRKHVWTCIDTLRSIESCGGCPGSEASVDCTDFDDSVTASCVNGQCQYELARPRRRRVRYAS